MKNYCNNPVEDIDWGNEDGAAWADRGNHIEVNWHNLGTNLTWGIREWLGDLDGSQTSPSVLHEWWNYERGENVLEVQQALFVLIRKWWVRAPFWLC